MIFDVSGVVNAYNKKKHSIGGRSSENDYEDVDEENATHELDSKAFESVLLSRPVDLPGTVQFSLFTKQKIL